MVFGDEEKKIHKVGEASNKGKTKEELNNEETRSEAKSKQKVSKLVRRLKNKKTVSRKKAKGALVSISKVDEDGVTDNVDTEIAVMNGKESIISVSMHDEDNITDDVGAGMAASVKNEAKKSEEKLEANSKNKAHKLRKTDKKKNVAFRGINEVVAKKTVKPEYSSKTKMKDKATGMIFMCSSKTKKDCFHYKVLGLPASKRDMVFKIYQGMRLFLFDYDLKVMYGIFKAAGPGGYNIEPKAFMSAFPSQVRFTVLEDCLPLPEEKFKRTIIDNYYSKSKFNCQLTSKQVKNLCILFKVASKGSKSKRLHESPGAEAPVFVDHLSKWPRRGWKSEKHTVVDQLHRNPGAETQTFSYHDKNRHHGWEERHPGFARDHLYSVDLVVGRRKLYASPVAHPLLPQSLQLPSASALPPSETSVHRRDQLRYHDQHLLDVELRHPDEFEHLDSFRRFHDDGFEHHDSHRRFRHQDEFEHRDSYRKSGHIDELENHDPYRRSRHQDAFEYRNSFRRSRHQDEFEYGYSCRRSRQHHFGRDPLSSAEKPPEYTPPASRRPASKYHFSAGPTTDYRSRGPVNRHRHRH